MEANAFQAGDWKPVLKDSGFPFYCKPVSQEVRLCKPGFYKPYLTHDKGSIFLKAQTPHYRNGVLTHQWGVEDEPRDMALEKQHPRDFFRSTYRRFVEEDKPTPISTYDSLNYEMAALNRKKFVDVKKRETGKFGKQVQFMIEREDKVKEMYGEVESVFSRHKQDVFRDLTEHLDSFRPPLPYISTEKKQMQWLAEKTQKEAREKIINLANRKSTSQFTDIDGHKRDGYNKWLDQSGVYWNDAFKQQHPSFTSKSTPFSQRLL